MVIYKMRTKSSRIKGIVELVVCDDEQNIDSNIRGALLPKVVLVSAFPHATQG